MHAYMLQRLFEISVLPNVCNFSLACCFAAYVAYSSRVVFFGRHLARNLRPAASKDELLLRIQAICNSLPQADIQKPTSYSSTYCNACWLHQILNSDT
ncbi:hypothetical protein TNCV_2454051 [Trichonephila clavipes]|nr:hypothetical protein TNCV_2454051 [Trichonephila clavipes]